MPYVTKRKKIRSLVNTQVYTGPHNSLAGRDALNCHPIQSITGLQAALDELIDGAGTVGRVAGFTASKTIGNTPMRFNTTSMGIGTDDLEELLNLHKDSAEDVLIALSNSNTGLFPLEVGVDNTGKGKIELGSYEDGKTIQMQAQTLDMLTDNFLLRRVISGIESKRVLGVDTTGKVEQTGVVYDSGSLTATNLTANTAVNGATITASGYVNSPVYLVGGVQIAPADIAGLQATLNSFMTLGGPIQFTPSNPDLNTLGNNEFVAAIASTTAPNRPGNYYTVINFPGSMSAGGNQRNFQLASRYAGHTNIFQMRSREDSTGDWVDWVELWHSGNFNPDNSVQGDNQRRSTNYASQDINTMLQSGFFRFDAAAPNNPLGQTILGIHYQHPTENNYAFQIFTNTANNDDLYYQFKQTATAPAYRPPVRLWTSANFDPSGFAPVQHNHEAANGNTLILDNGVNNELQMSTVLGGGMTLSGNRAYLNFAGLMLNSSVNAGDPVNVGAGGSNPGNGTLIPTHQGLVIVLNATSGNQYYRLQTGGGVFASYAGRIVFVINTGSVSADIHSEATGEFVCRVTSGQSVGNRRVNILVSTDGLWYSTT